MNYNWIVNHFEDEGAGPVLVIEGGKYGENRYLATSLDEVHNALFAIMGNRKDFYYFDVSPPEPPKLSRESVAHFDKRDRIRIAVDEEWAAYERGVRSAKSQQASKGYYERARAGDAVACAIFLSRRAGYEYESIEAEALTKAPPARMAKRKPKVSRP